MMAASSNIAKADWYTDLINANDVLCKYYNQCGSMLLNPSIITGDFTVSPTSGVAPLTVYFSADFKSNYASDILSYYWTFGDGATGTGANPSHLYASAGTYAVTLTVSGGTGKSTKFSTITVSPPVVEYPLDSDYDGIYSLSDGKNVVAYVYFRSQQGQMIAIFSSEKSKLTPRNWNASQGQLDGVSVQLSTVNGDSKSVIEINFTSTTSFLMTQTSCTHNLKSRCLFSNNIDLVGTKIW